ncbi:aromatic compounds catabolism protein [Thalassospira profundimaris]|uniref:Aromatic compounds catabolism protein n=1 Tax=Thalassospira profundimaris TaxID=502049 RepID=A0A367XMX7_9PROT|nr:PaaI family thioesterase [Thalassospira profundimaris]RCK54092.1 aromatic compounds catabolism protein [Thalassospira profundimaris]
MNNDADHDNLSYEQQHGSGLQEMLGYRLVEWQDDRAVVELHVAPRHCNRAGILHGGVLATLLDTASGYACCYCPVPGNVRRCLTLSLTTQFMGQAVDGDIVKVEAQRQGGGRKIIFTTATAYNNKGDIIASATGTFRYHRGSEDKAGVPRD